MTTSPGWFPTFAAASSPGWVDAGRDSIDVTLGGIRLRTDHAPMPEGSWQFRVHDIIGWWEPAPDRTETIEHPSGPGAIAGMSVTEDRQIIINGLIQATMDFGPGSLTAAQDELGALGRTLLVVDEPQRGLRREADVRLVAISPPDRYAPWLARVTISLVADDPLRYGSGYKTLTNGAQTLLNRGNETAWPVLDIVGPHSALSIVHPGGTWTLPALASGVVRTVDFREGAVFDGSGNHVFGAGEGSGPLPRVPAGGASWAVSGVGSGSIRARRTEAWS